MTRAAFSIRAIALILALVMLSTGCAFHAPRGGGFEPISHDASLTEGGSGLVPIHGHGGGVRAAIIVGVCFIIAFVFFVDLCILAYTIPHHRPFCCCVYVIDWCR